MTHPPQQPPHGGWWQQQAPPGPQWQGPVQPPWPAQPPGTPPQGQQPAFGGGFGSQYGGLGAFGEQPRRKRWKKSLLVGVIVVVVLACGGVAAWLLGAFQGATLDRASVQDEMTRVLRESYGEQDVTDPRCPADQPVRTGHTFQCSVTVAGEPRTVTIRVLNDKPEFEVGAPEAVR